MQKVCEDYARVGIASTSVESVVTLPLEGFQAMREINYLMKSPKNARRILEAIDEIETLINFKEID